MDNNHHTTRITTTIPNNNSNDTTSFNFLDLPPEIRRLIYHHLFQNTTVQIHHKTKSEYETSSSITLHTLTLPPAYNIIQTCKICHSEARPLFLHQTTLEYSSKFPTRNITTICSKSMASRIRRIIDILCIVFEDFQEISNFFPNLEYMGIIVHAPLKDTITEHQFENATYESWFERRLPISETQKRLLRWLRFEARFSSFVSTSVVVGYFGDNSRDFYRTVPVILDIKGNKVLPGYEQDDERYAKLFRS